MRAALAGLRALHRHARALEAPALRLARRPTSCRTSRSSSSPATTTTPSACSTRASTSCGRAAWAPSSARSSPASATRRPRRSRRSHSRDPTDEQREAIAAAAARLDELRNGWLDPPGAGEEELKLRTLTNLYNERPAWLRDIHDRLDAAVLAAYGWPADIATDDLLAHLLALNLDRASA